MPLESEVEEERAYVKLTILLSKDALNKLDWIKDKVGLASRGRAIQTIIEAVSDIQPDLKLLSQMGNTPTTNNPADDAKFYMKLVFVVSNIIRRLGFILV
jgi:hypothetical protein